MKNRFFFGRFFTPSVFGLALFFSATVLSAQIAVTVTTSAGDQTVNSLGWAVTYLNANGGGTIDIAGTVSQIPVSQPLAPSNQNVTFAGSNNVTITGQNNAQSRFFFLQGFTQQDNLTFQNNGVLNAGLDTGVTAAVWNMGVNSITDILGDSAATITTTSGVSVNGSLGGNAYVTVGTWNAGLAAYLDGGPGGSVTDTNGTGDAGGNGGNALAGGTSLIQPPGYGLLYLYGGNGGSVTDLGSGTNTGGNGGAASVSFGFVSNSSSGNLGVIAGNGGTGITGGAGGAATLLAGSVSLGQNMAVQGGDGANGVSMGGAGGSGFVSFGAYVGLPQSNFNLTGGNGGTSPAGPGAAGGNVSITGGSATITGAGSGNPVFKVIGGNGSSASSSANALGGNGGSAGVTLSSLFVDSGSTFKVTGGFGGNGASGTSPGNGGLGGDASISLGTFSIGVSTTVNLSSGSGGSGGAATSGTGAAGGAGGNLSLTTGTLNLGIGSNLTLSGGVGGAGGPSTGGTGGAGGTGGNISLSIGAVTMSVGNSLNIFSGGGGNGGLGSTSGSIGAGGQAAVSINDLEGAGTINMGGQATLSLGQGDFTGILAGTENFQKTGSGALTLAGSNTYSGSTSVNGGFLVVDTGGALGSGGVLVGGGTVLNYIHSSDASNAAVTIANGGTFLLQDNSTAGNAVLNNLSGGALNFAGNSTAGSAQINDNGLLIFASNSSVGSATVTVQSSGQVGFSGNATGGTSNFELATGSSLSVGGAISGVTIGSLDGSGNIQLGGKTLAEGVNNASTTLSGTITDSGLGGTLVKLGTGSLTLINTGNSNSYAGGTQVDAGVLVIGAPSPSPPAPVLCGPVAVNGGTLEENSVFVDQPVQVTGGYSQGASGTLQWGLGGPVTAQVRNWLAVTGNASLGGSLNIFSYGNLSLPIGTSVQLITTTGTVTGMFQQVQINVGTTLRLLPVYYPSLVALESINTSFAQSGITPNQKAIGADLDNVYLAPQLNSLMAVYGTMSNSDLQAAYAQISPEDMASLYETAFAGTQSRSALVEDRLAQFRHEASTNGGKAAQFQTPGGPWFAGLMPAQKEFVIPHGDGDLGGFVSGNGGVFNVTGDGNAAGYQATRYGLDGAGADIRLSKDLAVGLMAGYSHTDITLGTGGRTTDDGGQLGLYGLLSSGNFFADVLAEGGLHSYNIQRLSYGGLAASEAQGQQYDGALGLGYQWKSGSIQVGPVASAQFTQLNIGGFSEQGSPANLTYPVQSGQSLMARGGIRADGQWKLESVNLDPFLQLAYEHEFISQGGTIQAGFGAGDQFTVAGPRVGQDGFLVEVGGDLDFSKEIAISLHYEGEFGRTNLVSNQLNGGVRFGF